MRRVLLIYRPEEGAEVLRSALLRRGFEVSVEAQQWRAVQALRQPVPMWEFVVIVAKNMDDVVLMREIVKASQQFQQSGIPAFLFATRTSCTPSIRIQIGKMGARYVRF